jgi:hypothetical protein
MTARKQTSRRGEKKDNNIFLLPQGVKEESYTFGAVGARSLNVAGYSIP